MVFLICFFLQLRQDEPEVSEKRNDARHEEVVLKVEHDRTFKKPHHHHHHHQTKKGDNDVEAVEAEYEGQKLRSVSGVQTPQMFLLNQGLAVESAEFEEHDGDSDDFLNIDPLDPGDI